MKPVTHSPAGPAKRTSCCGPAAEGATVARTAIDPVCGMTVKADSPHTALHAGQRYVFCCAGCKTRFEADPARYLRAAEPLLPN